LHIHNHIILIKIAAASPNGESTREETLSNFQPRVAECQNGKKKAEPVHQHRHLEIRYFQSKLTPSLCSRRTPGTADFPETQKQVVLAVNFNLINLDPMDVSRGQMTNPL